MLGLLAAARAVMWLTEQPRSSLMEGCPYFRYAALALRPICWDSVSLYLANIQKIKCNCQIVGQILCV